jgi:Ca2+-binding EF-hand superfamily protein
MTDGRGFETFEEAFDITKKFRVNSRGEISKQDARRMFASLDVDGDNEVSEEELAQWVLTNQVFGPMSAGDVMLTVNRVFKDIDKNGDGSLQFTEFHAFMNGIVREQQVLKYVSRHHLTSLPVSLRKMNSKAFTLKAIEEALQAKIQQLTSRDSDRFRQILTMLKCQSQRSNDIPMGGEEPVMGISQRDFNAVLAMLGLFSTREQAAELFRRYDINGDGTLTAHEFLTKARPADYPGYEVDPTVDDLRMGRGKRMYLKESLLNRPVRPQTPSQRIYYLSKKEICSRIRIKLEQRARCGQVFSSSLARRTLNRIFEQYDEEVPKRGLLTKGNLKLALGRIAVPIGSQHMAALIDDHGVVLDGYPDDLFDYRGFVMACYPSGESIPSTSLFRPNQADEATLGPPPRPQSVQQWRSPSSKTPSRSRARTPSANRSKSLNSPFMSMGPNGYKSGHFLSQTQFTPGLPSV